MRGLLQLEEFETNHWNESDNSTSLQEVLCSVRDYLHLYYTPVMIAVGFVGNLLSCVVFLTTHLKMRSSSYYLAALAIADFGFLCNILVMEDGSNDIFNIFNTNGGCQLVTYLGYVCSSLSVWLIVAFTVERFIAVQYPLQRPHICTVSRAKTVVLSLTTVAIVSQLYIFWTAGMVKGQCELRRDYYQFMTVMNFIDLMATLVVPFVLIVTMNTMIARNLFLFRRRMQANSLNECLYTDRDNTELQISQSVSYNRKQGSQQSHNSQNSSRSLSKKSNDNQLERLPYIHVKMSARNVVSTRNQQNITKMLLLISSVFIALNLPSYVIRLSVYFPFKQQEKYERLICIQQIAQMLFYTNFSINFLLYAMCGVTFRRCFWQLVRNNLKRLCGRAVLQ